ncbi:arylsulfatase [bacterium]|nr:arylsulfatase [bacterium]
MTKHRSRYGRIILALWLLQLWFVAIASGQDKLPNVVIIYADDLGYGDVSCYNDQAKVSTPFIDRLAQQGLKFTDAHSAATVCTPSRYSLLTGRYAFRLPNHGRVFDGVGGPNLIDEDRLSLGQMFNDAGYTTACFGKWHVGMTFYDATGTGINEGGREPVSRIDYSRKITGSPIHRGFDHFFGTAACPTTDWLYAFIDGDHVPNPPKQLLDKTKLPKHPYSRDNRRGWVADDFDLERVDLLFLEKSQSFLRNHVRETPEKPFFLFHSMQAVHLPSFPAKEYQGASNAGPHGDFLHEMDDIVGKLLNTLDELDVADNTIVIFTSDNGPEVLSVFRMRTDYQHDGARPWRGVKRDTWEGGHRVPMIVRWPGKVPADAVTNQLFCQTDLMSTLATLIGVELTNDCAEDSFDMSRVFLGTTTEPVRDHIVHQGFAGIRKLAIRMGKWKYLNHAGSGGNNYAKSEMLKGYQLTDELDLPFQLYDLENDPGETENLAAKENETKERLAEKLRTLKERGRSVNR